MINDPSLLIDGLSAVMRLEEMRAQTAARNIAMANVPGHRLERFDAAQQMDKLRAAVADGSRFATEVGLLRSMDSAEFLQTESADASRPLDALVHEMSSASGRYQTLGEGVSRQFALMRLAIGGGK
jgi:flagellar basal body rod protein FlgB